jgi:hypothetical protein
MTRIWHKRKLSFEEELNDRLDNVLIDMSTQKTTLNKTSDFRVSGLPICPIRTLLYNERSESFSMSFYTSIGTAVHETAQKWLAVGNFSDKIYSCWKAVETGEIIGPCFKKDLPKNWDNYTVEYEEITILYNGLSGHVDLVLEIMPGKFMVVDFKTTDLEGKKRRGGNWRNQYPASRSSIIQISTYSTLLREIFGLNIVAWCLVYVDRGKVIRTRNDYYKVMRPWNKTKHTHMLEMLDRACVNDKRFRKLDKLLKESTSFNEQAVKLLKKMVIERPCIDEESYNEWIDYKFYKGGGATPEAGVVKGCCELKQYCLAGSKTAYKAITRRL